MKTIVKIEKVKNFSHVVGTETKEEFTITDQASKHHAMSTIQNILTTYTYDNEMEFTGAAQLEQLEKGSYYIHCNDFTYIVQII